MTNLSSAQFEEFYGVFIRMGWRGVENIFGRRNTINKQIVDYLDADGLREKRREYLRGQRAL
ncbi:MAG: hypothetical protein ACRCVX_12365 [Shewanella sp.]